MNKYAKWFKWVMWLGIITNLLLGLPAIFFPNTLLRLLHQRPSTDIVWTAFAGLLAALLALMYCPGARDLYRYRIVAKYAVIARLCSAIFLLILWPKRYTLFGVMDLVYFIVQGWLYYLATRDAEEWYPSTASS